MFGELIKVPLKEVWGREDINFTPWLADNIDKLGEALGLELELVKREASVGTYSLDILAKDLSTSHDVVIENQFNRTDHDHLGKLLTYAAGHDASIIIWIAEEFSDEHRQAIDWLNQRTDNRSLFFGVMLELLKIDDSKPAYNFKLVASPNNWQKDQKRQAAAGNITVRGEKYRKYFQNLIDELRTTHRFTAANIGQPQNWYSFSSGVTGITYGANFTNRQARTELYIDLGEQKKNEYVFDELQKKRTELEDLLGYTLAWEKLSHRRSCRIAVYTDGSIDNTEEELEEIKNWHIKQLLKFKQVFGSRLASLRDAAERFSELIQSVR